jgi:hypothetical protein
MGRSLRSSSIAVQSDLYRWTLERFTTILWRTGRSMVCIGPPTGAAPDGIPVILEVDRAGKANAGLRGHAHTSFEAMIHRVVREFGCPSAELKDSTELLRVHAEIEGNISLPAIPQMKRMALAGRIAHSIFHS